MRKSKRVTSQDVAQLAGLSRSTVSVVLSGRQDIAISLKARERVMAAARQLGYVPNTLARSLVMGASRTVALLLPKGEHGHSQVDPYVPSLILGVQQTCQEAGYRTIVDHFAESDAPGAFRHFIDSGQVDGLIINNPRSLDIPDLKKLAADGLPMVTFNSAFHGDFDHQVHSDNRSAAEKGVDHLLQLGHRHIAYIGFTAPTMPAVSERQIGFFNAMKKANAAINPNWLAYADYSAASGYDAMKSMLTGTPEFTALFAGNDIIAFGAMKALRDSGRRIPEDVAVLGYDDIPLAAFAEPPLSTLHISPYSDGCQIAQLLMNIMVRGVRTPAHQTIMPELVIRSSTGEPRTDKAYPHKLSK